VPRAYGRPRPTRRHHPVTQAGGCEDDTAILGIGDTSSLSTLGILFPHARLAARVLRTRTNTRTGASNTETVYAVTSLSWDQVTTARLAQLIRGHWAIENAVHHVRDTTYDEDRSQVRTGSGPRVMATLRNVAIGIIRTRHASPNVAATSRSLGRRTHQLLACLDHGQITPVTTASTLN